MSVSTRAYEQEEGEEEGLEVEERRLVFRMVS